MGSMPPTRQAPTAHTHMQAVSRLQQSPRPLALALGTHGQARSAPFLPGPACEVVEDARIQPNGKEDEEAHHLVLDCLSCARLQATKTADLVSLQHCVIKEKRLSGRETWSSSMTWCAWWRPCTR